ncbi:MAG: hypothetical protein ACFFAY_11230 [Promethearchaeota archaeon]
MASREEEIARLAKTYGQYLNGPLGKPVLRRLKEGETFTIKTERDLLRITKSEGRAIVRVEKLD